MFTTKRNLLFHWVKVRRGRTHSSIVTYYQYYRDVLSVRTRTYFISSILKISVLYPQILYRL